MGNSQKSPENETAESRATRTLPRSSVGQREIPSLLDIEGLAVCLGTSIRHVRRLVAERRIPYVKVGHYVRFDREEIARWLDDRRVPTRTTGGGLSTLV